MYFLENGRGCGVSVEDLMNKTRQELEYVHYKLQIKDADTAKWSEKIKQAIIQKKKRIKHKSVFPYVPKYKLEDGSLPDMPSDSAYFETTLTVRHSTFNPRGKRFKCIYLDGSMYRSKLPDLRAAIYQIWDSTEELKEVKHKMIQILVDAEEKLLKTFLSDVPGY